MNVYIKTDDQKIMHVDVISHHSRNDVNVSFLDEHEHIVDSFEINDATIRIHSCSAFTVSGYVKSKNGDFTFFVGTFATDKKHFEELED